MAGETVKTDAICLDMRPWSMTSHVVTWLTPSGRIATVVKGAMRPKSMFLGQYDLNYTCEIVYYARQRGETHILRECSPLEMRERLRGSFKALAVAGYFRGLARDYAPSGPECADWFGALGGALDGLCGDPERAASVGGVVAFELSVLGMLGLKPELEAESGAFSLRGERAIPVSGEVAAYLRNPSASGADPQIALDAARAIGVFYHFHLDSAPEVRRSVVGLVSKKQKGL